MRRRDIQNSIKRIENAFLNSNIFESLRNSLGPGEVATSIRLLESLKRFSIEYEKFSSVEKKILEIFKLKEIVSPDLWVKLMTPRSEKGERPVAIGYVNRINELQEFLPKVLELFKQDYIDIVDQLEDDRPVSFKGKEILTIILPEEGDHFSNPLRLSEILNSIILLYQSCALLVDESQDELSVLAIDSGSDKSFDFLGNAKVIECLKDLILSIWDRVVFYKTRHAGEKADLVAKTLPILEQVNQSEKQGKIGREQAEILRRNLMEGTEKFIETGAITPELERNNTYNPRQLMAPEQKMLVENTISSETPKNQNKKQITQPIDDEALSDVSIEDQALMMEIFRKLKEAKKSGNNTEPDQPSNDPENTQE